MKKMTYFVMVLALVLGFTQCKKEQIEPQNQVEQVRITLNVGGNGGSRHTINTNNGDVDFQNGDVIYVGDGSTYIGTLTRENDVFSGNINAPANNTEIYFYFVGGLTPSSDPEAGSTTSFTVDIGNQSSQMPVLSSNHVTYYSDTTSYSCVLQNLCALVKFTTASTTAPVHVGGLYTEAMIDFDNNSITNNGTTGFVNLHPDAEDNEAKWAVLLPQTGFEDAEAAIAHVGYTTTIPTIAADAFITGEDAVSISTQSNIVYLDWLTSNYTATDGQTLKGTLGANVKISIAADATVTLNNATITGTNDGAYSWAGITCENNTTLVIEGTNNVTSFWEDYAGIYIAPGETLTIQGSGTLYASSNGWGAGIGGSDLVDCGNIVINSGTINATGGVWMAGIGGGYQKSCGSITINGGDVTATGGEMGAGIGGGTYGSCGSITINGGNVTATGGNKAAGIGTGCVIANNTITGGDINISGGTVVATGGIGGAGIGIGYAGGADGDFTGGDINISGGTVVATGGIGAAGIGSGFVFYEYTTSSTCGNISITGGEVTATGGDGGENTSNSFGVNSYFSQPFYGGAGIGTGSSIYTNYEGASNCGTITIGNGVTRVTATKGGGTRPATNSIGKTVGYHGRSTCGTINIGGTVYPDGATPNQGDGKTFVYPAPPTAPEGAINGKFTINANGDQVYFSKGNLQYIGSAATPYWKFADHQWEYLGNNGQNSTSQTVDRDLFSWGTSGYNHNNLSYQPWDMFNNPVGNYYAYGNVDKNLYDAKADGSMQGMADWGYNPISNGGNTGNSWRTIKRPELAYILVYRPSTVSPSGIFYAKAVVNGINGIILLPDDWDATYYTLSNTNSKTSNFSSNTISESDWLNQLEPHGAVFFPAYGYLKTADTNPPQWVYLNEYVCYYLSSRSKISTTADWAVDFFFVQNGNQTQNFIRDGERRNGMPVRLIKDVQ